MPATRSPINLVSAPGCGRQDRVLRSWGVDGHNSHTNVCSAAARLGYALWSGADRPSPDFANARYILLLSSHLETGHYFNPHAQRIMEAKEKGAKLCAVADVFDAMTCQRAYRHAISKTDALEFLEDEAKARLDRDMVLCMKSAILTSQMSTARS